MSQEQFALWLAGEIKAGLCLKSTAVMYYRNRHSVEFGEALTDINIAIGDWNEGKRYSDVTPEYTYA